MSEKFAYHYSTFNFAAQLSLHLQPVFIVNKIHDLRVVAPPDWKDYLGFFFLLEFYSIRKEKQKAYFLFLN